MNKKFEDLDFIVLNDINTNGRFSSDDFEAVEAFPTKKEEEGFIRIYDLNDDGFQGNLTYDKLFEILEKRTDGLEPEIWY